MALDDAQRTQCTLGFHSPEPFVEINPADAAVAGLTDGGFAKVETAHGTAILKVSLQAGQQPGSIFAPIHWSDATAAHARVGDLVAPARDPVSGQPEMKATPARVQPMAFAYRGFAVTREPLALPAATWCARIAVAGGNVVLFASDKPPEIWQHFARRLRNDADLAEYIDATRGLMRIAAFRAGRLDASIFVGPADAPPRWDAVIALFASGVLSERERALLLSGRSADGVTDAGPVICACFGVGLAAVREAVASGRAANVADIGRALRAGTNCGSCLPELRGIIERAACAA